MANANEESGARPLRHAQIASAPELTIRAVLTGMLLGALLTPCNVYSGLKIGWAFNMSVAAGLLAFGLWQVLARQLATQPLYLLENNINQTAASAAASIISSGLAAPIPALTLLTGQTLAWSVLAVWLLAVSLIGVIVAAGLRNQLLERERLPFPSGVATATTLRQIHGGETGSGDRLGLLLSGIGVSAALKITSEFLVTIPKWAPSISARVGAQGTAVSPTNLGFMIDPSLLMVGFGAIAGLRVGISLMLGAVIAWGVLGPLAIDRGWAQAGPADPAISWFAPLVEWLLWPGATLMVVSALASFGFSMADVARRRLFADRRSEGRAQRVEHVLDRRTFVVALVAILVLAAAAQVAIFSITPVAAILAVLLSFVLAVAAARVSGETGITPVGALGKITQLTFGVTVPGSVTANLMTANVTGGAAGQCADMMHDLKCGQLIGATPRLQILAQVFGVLSGSLAGAAAYLLLIPDPSSMLITPEWPAPAVATWKAVAEVLAGGIDAMPPAALSAMIIAVVAGIGFSIAEHRLPEGWRNLVPSATAIGLAFCIPAWNSISLFLGAVGAAVVVRLAPKWAEHRIIVIAAGLVVGESLAGVVAALANVFR